MSFDLTEARTAITFIINKKEIKKATAREKLVLLKALIKNDNLLCVVKNGFKLNEKNDLALNAHIVNNKRRFFSNTDISVTYTCADNNKTITRDAFVFDDPTFYVAQTLQLNIKSGISMNEPFKLRDFQTFLLHEMMNCRHLVGFKCLGTTTELFTDKNINAIEEIIEGNRNQRLKYVFDWATPFSRILVSTLTYLYVINAITLPQVFLLLFMISIPTLISGFMLFEFRRNFLFKIGSNYLESLKNKKTYFNDEINECLIAGNDSKEWAGYLKSFVNPKTYIPSNYRAYAAGLMSGVEQFEVQNQAINKLRVI